ncbi:MAG: hypothetical protein QOF68_51 [Gaiellales bacterium]|nr:hypothetical protein [Gaiellales bacterium]
MGGGGGPGHPAVEPAKAPRVVMVLGELSAEVVIDSVDGSVYSSTMGIAN